MNKINQHVKLKYYQVFYLAIRQTKRRIQFIPAEYKLMYLLLLIMAVKLVHILRLVIYQF